MRVKLQKVQCGSSDVVNDRYPFALQEFAKLTESPWQNSFFELLNEIFRNGLEAIIIFTT